MRHLKAPLLLCLTLLSGCATLQQVMALRNVDFQIDRVSGVRLAGVDLDRVRTFEDLGVVDVARLTAAVVRQEVPLEFRLHVLAENPAENSVDARLVRLDWTLLLEDRETLNGTFADETVLRPGVPTDVPIGIELNLVEFFDRNAADLVDMALALADQGGSAKSVTLRATPSVDTSLGPIRYPRPIEIVNRDVGQ